MWRTGCSLCCDSTGMPTSPRKAHDFRKRHFSPTPASDLQTSHLSTNLVLRKFQPLLSRLHYTMSNLAQSDNSAGHADNQEPRNIGESSARLRFKTKKRTCRATKGKRRTMNNHRLGSTLTVSPKPASHVEHEKCAVMSYHNIPSRAPTVT